MLEKSSAAQAIDRARRASHERASASDRAPAATPLHAVDWYAYRRDRQLRMTDADRAEFRHWLKRIGMIYVSAAVIALAVTLTLARHVTPLDQAASGLRPSPIGSAAARVP